MELYDLKLEEQHFQPSPVKFIMLSPRVALSDVDARQSLIVVFGEFVPTACLRVKLHTLLTLGVFRSPAQSQSHPLGCVQSVENSQRTTIEGLQTGDLPIPSTKVPTACFGRPPPRRSLHTPTTSSIPYFRGSPS